MIKPDCIFCRPNKLLENEVVAQSAGVYAIEAATRPGNYLIIPEDHYETLDQLPDGWWRDCKAVLKALPTRDDYNLSINLGEQAGQRVEHLHFWVVPRTAGRPSSAKGLAALIAEIDGE